MARMSFANSHSKCGIPQDGTGPRSKFDATFGFALKCVGRGREEERAVAGPSAGRSGIVGVRLGLCLGLFPAQATTFGLGDAEVSMPKNFFGRCETSDT